VTRPRGNDPAIGPRARQLPVSPREEGRTRRGADAGLRLAIGVEAGS
jgi:hypothetical protein